MTTTTLRTMVAKTLARLEAQAEWCQGEYASGTPGTEHWAYVAEVEADTVARATRLRDWSETRYGV